MPKVQKIYKEKYGHMKVQVQKKEKKYEHMKARAKKKREKIAMFSQYNMREIETSYLLRSIITMFHTHQHIDLGV